MASVPRLRSCCLPTRSMVQEVRRRRERACCVLRRGILRRLRSGGQVALVHSEDPGEGWLLAESVQPRVDLHEQNPRRTVLHGDAELRQRISRVAEAGVDDGDVVAATANAPPSATA